MHSANAKCWSVFSESLDCVLISYTADKTCTVRLMSANANSVKNRQESVKEGEKKRLLNITFVISLRL